MKKKQELKRDLKQELLTEADIIRNLAYQFKEYSVEQLRLLSISNAIKNIAEEVRG